MNEHDVNEAPLNQEDQVDTDLPPVSETEEISGCVTGEEYGNIPTLAEEIPEEEEDEFAGKEFIAVNYKFNGDDVVEGLTVFQAMTIRKRNMVYTAILLAVLALYLANLIKNPSDMFSIILSVICVVILCWIWIGPRRHIKETAKAAEDREMGFHIRICDIGILVGQDDTKLTRLFFRRHVTQIFETPNLYLLTVDKARLFILPKRCLTEEDRPRVEAIFKNAMGDKYTVKDIIRK